MPRNTNLIINHTDACSTGNKEAGLVSASDWSRIPSSILKAKTATNFSFNSSTGKACCSK